MIEADLPTVLVPVPIPRTRLNCTGPLFHVNMLGRLDRARTETVRETATWLRRGRKEGFGERSFLIKAKASGFGQSCTRYVTMLYVQACSVE